MKTKEQIITFISTERDKIIEGSHKACDKYCETDELIYLKQMNKLDRVALFLRQFYFEVQCSPRPIESMRDTLSYYQDKAINYCKYLKDMESNSKEYKDTYDEITKLSMIIEVIKGTIRYAKS